jgi:hypothetical protein
VEHRRRGTEASGKVREAGHHCGSGSTVGRQKRPEAVTLVGGKAVWWSSVASGYPCSILESIGR